MRSQLEANIGEISVFEIKDDNHYAFQGLKNDKLVVVAPEGLEDDEALRMFDNLKRVERKPTNWKAPMSSQL